MLAWLPLLGAVGLTRDGAEMDAQSLAASLLAQQHAAEAHQRHMHHDGRAAHQKRGLPTMKELMEARQEAERHAGAVLVEPARPGPTSGGAPHQAQPAARVVEAHERQPEGLAPEAPDAVEIRRDEAGDPLEPPAAPLQQLPFGERRLSRAGGRGACHCRRAEGSRRRIVTSHQVEGETSG